MVVSENLSTSEPDDNDSSSADDDMTFDLDSEGVPEQVEEFLSHACRILGLTALNYLLQYVNWLVWEVCCVN